MWHDGVTYTGTLLAERNEPNEDISWCAIRKRLKQCNAKRGFRRSAPVIVMCRRPTKHSEPFMLIICEHKGRRPLPATPDFFCCAPAPPSSPRPASPSRTRPLRQDGLLADAKRRRRPLRTAWARACRLRVLVASSQASVESGPTLLHTDNGSIHAPGGLHYRLATTKLYKPDCTCAQLPSRCFPEILHPSAPFGKPQNRPQLPHRNPCSPAGVPSIEGAR